MSAESEGRRRLLLEGRDFRGVREVDRGYTHADHSLLAAGAEGGPALKGTIKIACQGADTKAIDELKEFQGSIKKLPKDNFEKLKRAMLEQGFSAPIFVWENAGDNMILDGHQRLAVLLKLRRQGYEIPLLPVVYVEAESENDARLKLLSISSQYGEFQLDQLYEFTDEIDTTTLALQQGELEVDRPFVVDNSEGIDTRGNRTQVSSKLSVVEIGKWIELVDIDIVNELEAKLRERFETLEAFCKWALDTISQ
ncbi:MAG TPA: hypothetical protein DG761_08835 [Gammaproteobacteria bacterium]|nr:hypothetical protein [Gammaproteobacteria bacterium]